MTAKIDYRRRHPVCEACGRVPAVEVHHAKPTFHELTESVFAATTPAEQDSALAAWDWFQAEEFLIPDDHALAVGFDELHAQATLQALCKRCHNLTRTGRVR